jgi:hypothetical protein
MPAEVPEELEATSPLVGRDAGSNARAAYGRAGAA